MGFHLQLYPLRRPRPLTDFPLLFLQMTTILASGSPSRSLARLLNVNVCLTLQYYTAE